MKISKRAIVISSIVILVAGIAVLANYLWQVNEYRSKVAAMQFSNIDITSIPDGAYTGASDVGFIAAAVEVTVMDGVITSIDLLSHKNGRGIPAERIVIEILEKQTTDVDAISGATNSSRVIRKAIENALLSE